MTTDRFDRTLRKPRHRWVRPTASAEQAPEQQPAEQEPTTATPVTEVADLPGFDELGLPEALVRALRDRGITHPFPIQAATLPDALAGHDVLGRGQTGSGKTLAFGLPMLVRLAEGESRPLHPRGLVLVPTRELAMQVQDSLAPFARALGLSCSVVVGGTSFPKQVSALRRGVDLLIATPGRLNDHVRQGTCVLGEVAITALDEADHMADLGFLPDVRAALDLVAPDGQRLLFSATLDGDVDVLVRRYLVDPVTHSVAPPAASVPTMEHHLLLIGRGEKSAVVSRIAAREGRTILFARTQQAVDRLTEQLRDVGVRARGLHGGKSQAVRTRTLAEFREGRSQVLVATDVAARGIHVDGIDLVVHVDPPNDAKDYLHRAGRTARAGEAGTVVTIVQPNQRRKVQALTRQAGVEPISTRVAPEDEDLARITGAREPSGVPVVEEPAPRRGGKRFGGGSRQGGGRGGWRGERRDRGDHQGRHERGGDRSWRRDQGERRDRGPRREFGDRHDRPARESH
ncbi:DEAD/DEAH box helicase [Streptoalloteichus hindustanus]|uniref:DEAD/DEAH box helicase n=1 Tax=Streptoalloteichus hindustanus TaxID=2017 RepID=UPI00389B2AA3